MRKGREGRWRPQVGRLFVAGLVAMGFLGGCVSKPPVAADIPPPAGGGRWLDAPLKNWNTPKAQIPSAPAPIAVWPDDPSCSRNVRSPRTVEDHAVRAAGWFLIVGSAYSDKDTTLIRANTAVDGMCRPLGYQVFVFVDGVFAGTLSPVPMHSRADGALVRAEPLDDHNIVARYSRYAASDPLCCPSRTSTVTFRIDRAIPLVTPVTVTTERQ
jgi:hypothetical protein